MSAPKKGSPKKRNPSAENRVIARGPWHVPRASADRAKDLPFVRFGPPRPEFGNDRLIESWWDVQPAKIDYCHVHLMHGRALAFEMIDALRNPDGEIVPQQLGCVLRSMIDWARGVAHDPEAMRGIAYGFGCVLGEYIQRHTASR